MTPDKQLIEVALIASALAAQYPRAHLNARKSDDLGVSSGWSVEGSRSSDVADPTFAGALAEHDTQRATRLKARHAAAVKAMLDLHREIALHANSPSPRDRERALCENQPCPEFAISLGKCRQHYDQHRYETRKASA